MKRVSLIVVGLVLAAGQVQAAECSLRVRALIDGQSDLHIQGESAFWHHNEAAAPGRHSCPGVNEPTTLGPARWFPIWPDAEGCDNRDCDCDSSTFEPLCPSLPAVEQEVQLDVKQARDDVSIAQQPNGGNGYELIVRFDDPEGGSDFYEINLRFECDNDNQCAATAAPVLGSGGVIFLVLALFAGALVALRRRTGHARSEAL